MANSSTYIMDLPENITMNAFSDQSRGGGGMDMDPTTYRQMNPHPNPYLPGQQRMDSMPLPEYSGRNGAMPPQSIPPSYDFEQGPLGNAPQFSLPPKDIPLDMSGFRDETAKPNYVPPAHKNRDDYVFEQEERIKETKQSNESKKSINRKFDIIAELQMPIIIAVLFLVFQMNTFNTLMSRYLKFAGLFGEDGNLNIKGMVAKSILFGSSYYAIINAAKWLE